MEDDDDVKFLSAQIGKMRNSTKVKILGINKTALLTKIAIGKKRWDVSIRKRWVI